MPRISKQHYRQLCDVFASIRTAKEADKLLSDMLTPQEIESMAERWQLIQLLAAGVPQREIAKKLGISISKITRGSRMLQFGSGGFRTMLKRKRQ